MRPAAIKPSSCSTIVFRSSAKKQVDLTAYRSSPSGARLFLVRINLKYLLSAFELPVKTHFCQSVARILPIAEAAFVHAIQKIPCPCSYPDREIKHSIKNVRSLYCKSYCIFRIFRKINSSIVLIDAFFLNGSSPANLRLHLQELRCSLFSGLHFCLFRGIFLIYTV